MPAVIAADPDCADVFLDCRPHHVARAAMVAQINHFNAGADQLQIDGVDGAVMSITDGNGGKNTKWMLRAFHRGMGASPMVSFPRSRNTGKAPVPHWN